MTYLMSIFLGLVQGITEFLPISSSGHLAILQNLFGLQYSESQHLFFDALLHLGTLISVCIFYWRDLKPMVTESISFVTGKGGKTSDDAERFTPAVRTVCLILVTMIPLFVAVFFNGYLEKLFYNSAFIGFALVITGTLLYVSDKLAAGRKNEKTTTLLDALIIGVAQAIAIVPGLSRSGTTITVARACGLDKGFAVRFSFLISIPAIVGANLITLIKALFGGIDWSLIPVYLVGMIVAAVSGYFAIRLVKLLVDRGFFGKCSYYCWGVGMLAIILSIIL